MKKSNAVLLGTVMLIWVSVALYALGFRGEDPAYTDLDFVYTEKTVDLATAMKGDGSVEINNMGGKIDIVCWDKDSVRVTGTLQKKVKEVKVHSDGHKTRVMVVYYDKKNGWQIRADLKIMVPRHCSITAHSISADILVKDHLGSSVFAHTVSGNVVCHSDADNIDVKSVSGDLTLNGQGRKAEFDLVSGDFKARGNYPEVSGKSVSGTISVTSDSGRAYSLKSTSGNVSVACGTAEKVTMRLKTISGDVRADFGVFPRVSYALKSTSGDISGYMYSGKGAPQRFTAKKVFNVAAEEGNGQITVSSVSGDIMLGHGPENL